MRFRKVLINVAEKHGVSAAARRYKTNRQYIYRWKRRYDSSWDSFRELSRRPHHHHPNPKYIPKPYEQMTYPCQKIQIDVKYVPAASLVSEAKYQKFYQYTAIDGFSR